VGEFDWDNAQQGLIHGSFYWGYVLSMVPGGMLAENYGAKLIFGGSNLICSLIGFLLPLAARTHLNALLAARFFQGFAAVFINGRIKISTSHLCLLLGSHLAGHECDGQQVDSAPREKQVHRNVHG